ncbi:MAG: hypothetical protein GY774_04960 [Planctomycetes bacterium]|nr:hypothetical protein [Planctomycetota bacterium]
MNRKAKRTQGGAAPVDGNTPDDLTDEEHRKIRNASERKRFAEEKEKAEAEQLAAAEAAAEKLMTAEKQEALKNEIMEKMSTYAEAAAELGVEVINQDGDEVIDPDKYVSAWEMTQFGPAKLEEFKSDLESAGAYVAKFTRRAKPAPLSASVSAFQKHVRANMADKAKKKGK